MTSFRHSFHEIHGYGSRKTIVSYAYDEILWNGYENHSLAKPDPPGPASETAKAPARGILPKIENRALFPHSTRTRASPPDRGRPIYTTPSSPHVFSLPQPYDPTYLRRSLVLRPRLRPSLAGGNRVARSWLPRFRCFRWGFFRGGIRVFFPPRFPGLLDGLAAPSTPPVASMIGSAGGEDLRPGHRRRATFPQFFPRVFGRRFGGRPAGHGGCRCFRWPRR
jgi:hypothetical protein